MVCSSGQRLSWWRGGCYSGRRPCMPYLASLTREYQYGLVPGNSLPRSNGAALLSRCRRDHGWRETLPLGLMGSAVGRRLGSRFRTGSSEHQGPEALMAGADAVGWDRWSFPAATGSSRRVSFGLRIRLGDVAQLVAGQRHPICRGDRRLVGSAACSPIRQVAVQTSCRVRREPSDTGEAEKRQDHVHLPTYSCTQSASSDVPWCCRCGYAHAAAWNGDA